MSRAPLVTFVLKRAVEKVLSIVIWSALIENGFDLAVCAMDGVVDKEFDAECRSARPDRYRTAMCCRLVGRSRSPVVAEFAEGAGELAAQPLVLVGEFAVAAVGDFEAMSQGVVAGALLGGYRCARLGSALVAESADLVGEVGLGVAARLLRTAGSHQ